MSKGLSGTFIPDDEVKKKRLPVPAPDLVKIQKECMDLDDEPRWLIALMSDTGMRRSEQSADRAIPP